MSCFGAPGFGSPENILHQASERLLVFNQETNVSISIDNSLKTSLDFSLHGKLYQFIVTQWSARGFSNFYYAFHKHEQRNTHVFGGFSETAEGFVAETPVTREHKIHVIMQACRDIITCLNKIFSVHGRGILDYAVWYRETHKDKETYSQIITLITCHSIVHSNLLAPLVRWELVQF